MIVWSGLGFLVAVVALACLFGTQMAVTAITGDPGFYKDHGWTRFLAFVIAAGIMWPMGRAINRKHAVSETVGLGPDGTEQRNVNYAGGGHTFFFVPMEYWALLLIPVGIWFAM